MKIFIDKTLTFLLSLTVSISATPFWAHASYVDVNILSASFNAGVLDMKSSLENFVATPEPGEYKTFDTIISDGGSVPFEFDLLAANASCIPEIFDALEITVENATEELYDGPLSMLSVATSTSFGSWRFELHIPSDTEMGECSIDLKFRAWQLSFGYDAGGFTDEETISIDLNVEQEISDIVLNEFLPRPAGEIFGNDNDDKPRGEWVELYNNTDTAKNLEGWYVMDGSEGEGNKVVVSSADAAERLSPETTTIPASGYLVIYMNKQTLNNPGDTIRLFNNSGTLIDIVTYGNKSIACSNVPTKEAENSDTTDENTCNDSNVPANKSFARIPDGVGEWVDPIPTPGRPNKLDELGLFETQIVTLVDTTDNDVTDMTDKLDEMENITPDTLKSLKTGSETTGDGTVDESAGMDATILEKTSAADVDQEASPPQTSDNEPVLADTPPTESDDTDLPPSVEDDLPVDKPAETVTPDKPAAEPEPQKKPEEQPAETLTAEPTSD